MRASTAPSITKGEQTRRSILDAAIARFGREGFRATSVADIARDASVGGTVAYAYFPNKEALFLAALDEDAAAVIDQGVAGVLDAPDARRWREELSTPSSPQSRSIRWHDGCWPGSNRMSRTA